MAFKNGQMGQNMKENGKMVRQTVTEHFTILAVIYIKAIGKMIKQMEEVYILQWRELNMMGSGLMIARMDMA